MTFTHCQHLHNFASENQLAEKNTRRVTILTAMMMVIEITSGWLFNSMALLSDGWHMSSHVVALGLSALAYNFSRRYAHDPRFSFGTWKIEVLGSYTSAILLAGVALYMAVESVRRLFEPAPIHFNEAIPIAVLGLVVNLISAWMLKDAHHHGDDHHGHSGGHGHHHHGQDLNLRAAYIHVAADAATSVLAIIALVTGKFLGWTWLDPVMGLIGAVVVAAWVYGLIGQTAKVLLDADMTNPVVEEIREVITDLPGTNAIHDLHVWRVGQGKFACIVGIRTDTAMRPEDIRQRLQIHEELVHISVEISPLIG
jgi:cation diffusion facilitator family transporter